MKSVLFWLLLVLGGTWAGIALWVQFPQARWLPALFACALAAVISARLATPYGWPALGLLTLAVTAWYLSLSPRADRDWAPDVAHLATGRIDGNIVTLHNLRAFRWQDRDHATESWETRRLDLDHLATADMVTSVWSNPDIAHLLVSFGFTDGQRVVFSVEIRREKGEKFSSIGGFFRQFELALIAADEEDIVKLRTHHRAEDVRLYPLRLTPDQLRVVFLEYVKLGNDLAAKPRWYNTVTANCTTVVWHLTRALNPDLGLDPSLLLSGRLPAWLYRMNLIALPGTLAEIRAAARISPRALAAPEGADFSAAIRAR